MTVEKVDTKNKIMDLAEQYIISGGYGAFSFRDLADDIGIKSASVHYHFRTKSDLVAAVMFRYTDIFSKNLPDPTEQEADPQRMLNGFIDGFKAKIVDQNHMSLCTMLTADKHILPEEVNASLTAFYDVKITWLTQVCLRLPSLSQSLDQAHSSAVRILASLHGASVLVQATGNEAFFEQVVSAWR
ncbi:TetR/AcrR family transcriptional regulator [Marinomonas posidonica]|uniref:Regulatory protein TetR n=1 Tax=Marinomonas posidonica (strain CECT 7376 / NCIMB 14433 / IVIA-Po-181) TaxID=491952 RepID=F6CYY8_MARPP|nr:helix-turn-helix domain-containing protein [Marinomonas posidonica]AEF53115.1 regulatory protein TetR [Marinomonas posidonica IVIA-Po-181]